MEQTSTAAAPFLSVVLPAYNEEARLKLSLPVILEYLNRQTYNWEIILIDDGSNDRTSEIAEQLLAGKPHTILRNNPNAGKGESIKRGMLAATGKWRLFSDADLSTPIEEVNNFLARISQDPEIAVVIGSRALADSKLAERQPFYREFMGRVFNVCVQMLILPGIHDTQCGFKLFSDEAANTIFPKQQLKGFSFDCELLILARNAGFKISECPITWINDTASKVNPVTDSIRMFVDLLRLRKRLKKKGTQEDVR